MTRSANRSADRARTFKKSRASSPVGPTGARTLSVESGRIIGGFHISWVGPGHRDLIPPIKRRALVLYDAYYWVLISCVSPYQNLYLPLLHVVQGPYHAKLHPAKHARKSRVAQKPPGKHDLDATDHVDQGYIRLGGSRSRR